MFDLILNGSQRIQYVMFILYEEVATKLNNNAYVSITRRMGKSD